jgi:RNA polymerase sigma-70 factor (ECF subfamily)
MACQIPDRSDRDARYPRMISPERRKLRPIVSGAPQFEKRPTGRDGREPTAGVGELALDDEAAPAPRLMPPARGAGQEARAWITRLQDIGPERDAALVELHAVLLRAARFEIGRRADAGNMRGGDYDDLAQQSADDALVVILRKLGEFRGESRFTTWAYKFAIYEAAANMRKRSWQGREIPLAPEAWPLIADQHQRTAQQSVESIDQLSALREAIEEELTPHQREVLVALALNDVPINVLAERLGTTRGALYKTLHDARQKLRAALTARGLGLSEHTARSLSPAIVANAPKPVPGASA